MNDSTTPAPVPGRLVGSGELAAALQVSRQTIVRWIDAGRIPEPWRAPPGDAIIPSGSDHPVGGPWRRWPIKVAIEIVKKAGRPLPDGWQESEAA